LYYVVTSTAMATSVRLDPETERLINRLRRQGRTTKSAVIREAIRHLAERDLRVSEPDRPYTAVKHLIGSIDSGGKHLSGRTGVQFTELLLERRRARRPR